MCVFKMDLISEVKMYNVSTTVNSLSCLASICPNLTEGLLWVIRLNKLPDQNIFVEKLGVTEDELDYIFYKILFIKNKAMRRDTNLLKLPNVSDDFIRNYKMSYDLNKKVKNSNTMTDFCFSEMALNALYKICMVSLDVVDDSEYQTLTGYEKEEVLVIANDIAKIISQIEQL